MRGMSRTTGKALEATDDLAQSIADILTTPIVTRVERRLYSSLLPLLIDQPMNAVGRPSLCRQRHGSGPLGAAHPGDELRPHRHHRRQGHDRH